VHERSARISLDERLTYIGLEHIRQAQSYYRKWGADHHVSRLEYEFKGMFTLAGDRNAGQVTEIRIQATDTFTDQIVVTAIKYSGALQGKLISVDKDEFLVIANTRIFNGASEVASETTQPTSETIPTSILRQVVDSAQSLRYGHAVLEAGAPHAASLKDCPVRSVLCVPLINNDQVFSVLYLENNALSDAFSLETEQAIELFMVAASKALVLKAELDEERETSLVQSHREKSMLTARADLIKNSHITVLGGMAASIVHEVNQPLSAISTFANSGTRWLRQSTPQIDKAITNFSKIEESSLRASAIISALRSLAKQAPANLEFVSFNQIVANVLEFIETDDRTNNLRIDCVLVENSTVFADAIQIQQVVYNLVTNALDAMEAQNAGRSLKIVSELRDGSVVLSVSDNGSGIPATSRETIFDPFFTTKDRGLGMGLAICRSIAKVHGGDLLVGQSNANGTTMIFRLPVHNTQ
jgi:signal transduction histidine kinase